MDKEKQEKVFDILAKMEFFQGQRAGRELWNDKPKEVQDQDIADFVRDIKYIRSHLKDSVVLTERELLDNCELNYDKGYKQGSKETAEKILKELWHNKFETIITIKNSCSKEDVENIGKEILISIRNKLKEIATREGVEIKE